MPHEPLISASRCRIFTESHPRTAIMPILCLGMIVGIARPAAAQLTWQATGVTTPSPIGYLSVLNDQTNQPAVCHDGDGTLSPDSLLAGDGNFVKKGTTLNNTLNKVQPDTSTYVTGICQAYIGGEHYAFLDVPRNIDYVVVTQRAGYQLTTPWSAGQSLDTRNPPATGTPLGPIFVSTEGTYTIQFQTLAASTPCGIPIYSAVTERHFNAVACLPTWNVDGSGSYPRFPTDQSITLIYPSNLSVPVKAAGMSR